MPAVEAVINRFRAADTQVLGLSVDSVYSHANWGRDLGGVSFPLLSDFEPKGAVASSFGHYLEKPGITDRATVIVDKKGIVRYSEAVGPGGERYIVELAAECEKINAGSDASGELPDGQPVPDGTVLYVKSECGHSQMALLAVDNLHVSRRIAIKNVTEDATAAQELEAVGGQNQAPCLIWQGEPRYEADAIVEALVVSVAPILE